LPTIIVDDTRCKGCEMCVIACPRKIIVLDKSAMNGKGYHPARLADPSGCTGCGSCALMCPDVAITVIA
jgi:2-oxoglutarate ferredoxin oxidoreductase subunit delta